MTQVISLEAIERVLPLLDVVALMEKGFVAYSEGRAVVPPVGELIFEDPPGETHIKYGYIRGGDHYVIKIASGFYGNADLGLPSGSGMMLLFSQKTGFPDAVLLDEGRLTDVRTAAAGAVAAKHLAPSKVERIGILGGGVQARLQLELMLPVVACREVLVWMRDPGKFDAYREYFAGPGAADRDGRINSKRSLISCNLIVTTTPSRAPLLQAEKIRPGTHITAIGSDTVDKIELAPEILGHADAVVVDSLPQSESSGRGLPGRRGRSPCAATRWSSWAP